MALPYENYENLGDSVFASDSEIALVSIAISMKRIADLLATLPTTMESLPVAIEGAIWNAIRQGLQK